MSPGGQTLDVDLKAMMESLWAKVRLYNPQADEDKLWFGYRFAKSAHEGQKRKSGEPFFAHAMTVASILADLRLDVDTLIAAMVHDVVEDTDYEMEDVRQRFGQDVAHMVDGVTKISGIRAVNKEARKAETYRKLVLAIAQDPRTVLILVTPSTMWATSAPNFSATVSSSISVSSTTSCTSEATSVSTSRRRSARMSATRSAWVKKGSPLLRT